MIDSVLWHYKQHVFYLLFYLKATVSLFSLICHGIITVSLRKSASFVIAFKGKKKLTERKNSIKMEIISNF